MSIEYAHPPNLRDASSKPKKKRVRFADVDDEKYESCGRNGIESRRLFEHNWTLYHDINWTDIQKIYKIRSIRDFWCVHNNMPVLTELQFRTNLSFFKEDILPVWESPENENGGKWCADLKLFREELNDIWLMVLLGLVGETVDPTRNEIVGVTIHLRRNGDRIAIWTRTTNSKTQIIIGRRLKKILKCPIVEFKTHKDAMQNQSSYESPPLYVV